MTLTLDLSTIALWTMIAIPSIMFLCHVAPITGGVRWFFGRVWTRRKIVAQVATIPLFFGALGTYLYPVFAADGSASDSVCCGMALSVTAGLLGLAALIIVTVQPEL